MTRWPRSSLSVPNGLLPLACSWPRPCSKGVAVDKRARRLERELAPDLWISPLRSSTSSSSLDLAHRFRGVEAEVDGDATVRFPRLGYAEAVRRHFWSNYPGLRENLQRWVAECDSRIAWPGAVGRRVRSPIHRCVLQRANGRAISWRRSTDWAFGNYRPGRTRRERAGVWAGAIARTRLVVPPAMLPVGVHPDASTADRRARHSGVRQEHRPEPSHRERSCVCTTFPGTTTIVCRGSRWIRTVFLGRRSSGPSPIAGSTDHLPPRSYRPSTKSTAIFSWPWRDPTALAVGGDAHRSANRRSRRSR